MLPTVGGQTALNLAVELAESGVLERYRVELIGASLRAIKVAEDRLWFKDACRKIGLDVPASALVNNRSGCAATGRPTRLPRGHSAVVHARRHGRLDRLQPRGVRRSHLAWRSTPARCTRRWWKSPCWAGKSIELEVMRDFRDNFVVICSIENFDPMGVHTGDSITVAPAQTLTDKEYQRMRDAAAAIIREVGVETGGSNIQFAIDPPPAAWS